MTERIDHAAEAREALRGSGDGRNFATDASNNAIAHAVLALEEQQRIANRIAFASQTYVEAQALGEKVLEQYWGGGGLGGYFSAEEKERWGFYD